MKERTAIAATMAVLGLFGSWYAAEVMEMSFLKFSICIMAAGAFWLSLLARKMK